MAKEIVLATPPKRTAQAEVAAIGGTAMRSARVGRLEGHGFYILEGQPV